MIGYLLATPLNPGTLVGVPLSLILGGIASAWLEFANTAAAPSPTDFRKALTRY